MLQVTAVVTELLKRCQAQFLTAANVHLSVETEENLSQFSFSAKMIQSANPSIRSREEKTENKIINTAKNTNVPLWLIHLGKNLKKKKKIEWIILPGPSLSSRQWKRWHEYSCMLLHLQRQEQNRKKYILEKKPAQWFCLHRQDSKRLHWLSEGWARTRAEVWGVCGLQRITNIHVPHMGGNSLILAAKPRTGSEHNRAFHDVDKTQNSTSHLEREAKKL